MDRLIDVYISLGTNIGNRRNNIDTALNLISHIPGVKIGAVSSTIETEPWGFSSDRKFFNCVSRLEFFPDKAKMQLCNTDIKLSENNRLEEALYLLNSFKNIEWAMGRRDKIEFDTFGNRVYHSRIIDIDILFYGKYRIDTKKLVVPHPLMAERDFVMRPLMTIADENIKSAFPEIFQAK